MRDNGPGSFGPREFRNALGQFATGVVIVTTAVDGDRLGATISSFNSVSLDPPLVLFSIARTSRGLPSWKRASAFCISVLGESQREISNRFARANGDKWTGLDDRRAGNGCPLLPGEIAHFECVPHAVHDGGDHEIFVCKVTAFETGRSSEPPLIFHGGTYRSLNTVDGVSAPLDDNMWLHGW